MVVVEGVVVVVAWVVVAVVAAVAESISCWLPFVLSTSFFETVGCAKSTHVTSVADGRLVVCGRLTPSRWYRHVILLVKIWYLHVLHV
jgi:hypothetical protein